MRNYVAWEDDVIQHVEEMDMTHSDAEALVMGQPAKLAQCWSQGLNAGDTAAKVVAAATPAIGG